MLELNVVQSSDAKQPSCACTGEMERVWIKSPRVEIFHAGYYENAAGEDGRSPYFDDRRKYKNYLKENGMYADYVEGR